MSLSFVVAAPRSGTTWLQEALSAIPNVVCIESRAYGQFFDVWPRANQTSDARLTIDNFAQRLSGHLARPGTLDQDFPATLTRALLDEVHNQVRKQTGAQHVIEKITPYVGTSPVVLDALGQQHPASALCHLMRDGRDVVTSGVFHWLQRSNTELDRRRFFVDGDIDHLERFFDDAELRLWCRRWAGPVQAMLDRDQTHLDQTHLDTSYEAMLEDPFTVLRDILTHFEIPASHSDITHACEVSTFTAMSAGRQRGDMAATAHVRNGIAGDWQKYFTRRDGEIFLEEAGHLLTRVGYTENEEWLDALPVTLELVRPGSPAERLRASYRSATEALHPCALCNRDTFVDLANVDRHKLGLHTRMCTYCGMASTNPRPPAAWYEEFYQRDYWPTYIGSRFADEEDMFVSDHVRERSEQILSAVADQAGVVVDSFLDIGSGQGGMLAAVQRRFPHATLDGVEPSESGVRFTKERFAIDVARANWDEQTAAGLNAHYSLITMIHMLEHAQQPVEALRWARECLTPDGLLYVEVPNVASDSWRGRGFFHVAHTHYFTPETLTRVARAAGLEPIAMIHGAAEMWPWASGLVARRGVPREPGQASSSELAMVDHVTMQLRPRPNQ